ncbi:MAG: Glu-tRNA(Gln) amidotransferase subunit GatD [Candidatus Aenigmarchaeota archaeon]|nr:Glu-tRNA(Gln) amidotransferase subunit GatD [Candidatus Aenigmarchaeota archaeon]
MAYSPELERILKEKGIKVGNRVRVEKNGHVYEGLLMPRIEVGDEKTLIIKLDSGYNVGIKYEKGVRIEKVGEGKEPGKIPRLKIRHNTELPDVVMIATGGTIGTHVDYLTGGVYMCRDPEEILFMAPEVTEIINLKKALRPFTLASEDMTPDEWKTLAKLVAKELNEGAYGVIITHGTDTMHYTSAALSFMLRNLNKPVVMVGAQRSPDRGSFDGAMNLICASHVVKSDIAEVVVVMHGTTNDDYCLAIRGTKVRKMHSSRRDAFRPINEMPIAKVWQDGKIEILNEHRKRKEGKVEADAKFEPKVAIVKAYPGSNPKIIDWYVDNDYKGLVIEGTGFGHVPTQPLKKEDSWIPHVKDAVERGVFIGITTQTIYGRTNPYVYRNLRLLNEAGGVHLEDMLTEVAYVKLGWVLGHTKSMKKVKGMMLTNYAGEITKTSDPRSFLY